MSDWTADKAIDRLFWQLIGGFWVLTIVDAWDATHHWAATFTILGAAGLVGLIGAFKKKFAPSSTIEAVHG